VLESDPPLRLLSTQNTSHCFAPEPLWTGPHLAPGHPDDSFPARQSQTDMSASWPETVRLAAPGGRGRDYLRIDCVRRPTPHSFDGPDAVAGTLVLPDPTKVLG
jgi:hypothetical protein